MDARTLHENHELIADLARFSEGGLSQTAIRKKWRLSEEAWLAMGGDEKLVEAIELEVVRRERSGICARERAQKLFAETPAVLGGILHNDSASPRHRIESAREIRQIAAPELERQAEDRFIIEINLGEDRLLIDKQRGIVPDSDVIDITPIAAIAAGKREENGGGEPL
jgi:hypothetical protein